MPTYEQLGFGQGAALTGDRARAVFGQVMGLVAFALGFAALGAYIARDMTGGTGIIFFIGAFACIFGLQAASARGHEQLAIALLFGMALLLGMAISPIIVVLRQDQPRRRLPGRRLDRAVRRRPRHLRLLDATRSVADT